MPRALVSLFGSSAGAFPAPPSNLPTDVLDLIAAADANSWVKLNTNTYQSIWPPADYRPLINAGTSSPHSTFQCWASFGWDDVNFRAILWGGGHANSNDNAVYTWNAATRLWELSFYSSDVVTVTGGMGIEPVDWPAAPQSSHTYDTQVWLPIQQRFLTFGGAASSSGGSFFIRGSPGRQVGCFMLDMAQAGSGKVGGTTGSNVHRGSTVGIDLTGANAWTYRDWFLDHADPNGALSGVGTRANGVGALRIENGHETYYWKGSNGPLTRFEMVDSDYHNDIISRVGQAWSVLESSQGGSLDLGKNLFICMIDSTTPFDLWDLNTAGPFNKDINVPAAGLGGSGAAEFLAQMAGENTFAIEYDERRGHHVAWQRGGRVYVIEAPASAPWDTGWTVTKIADDTLPVRPLTVAELNAAVQADTSVTGKWRRSPVLDVYIGMQKYTDGDVWAFKPDNWVDPR